MRHAITVETVAPRILAAVRARVATHRIGAEFKPHLDQVWAFLARHPGLRDGGHNVFLYHHDASGSGPPAVLTVDFGVEVTRAFAPEGQVACVTTPAGDAAQLVHRGPYEGLRAAHAALHAWCAANGRSIGAHSLEIYGDWSSDPSALETTIQYLLR